MSIIQAVRDYMADCPLLAEIPVKDRHIDWTSASPGNYGIFVDSDNLTKKFISGGGKHEYNFAVQFRLKATEAQELENAEFMERMQKWCSEKNAAKEFPKLPKGCTPTKITTANAMLFDRDKSGKTALYQVQFKLFYTEVLI